MGDLIDRLDGVVHAPTQDRDDAVDLTVAAVYEINGPGQIDFGGGELESATLAETEPTKRSPDDDYGWWELDAGTVLLEFNERLTTDDRVHLQPRRELCERGATHPTILTSTLPRVPLTVGNGLRLKENARVSTIVQP